MRWCWRSPPTTSSSTLEEFRATCLAGLKAAEAGHIVTFGITPSAPKTSYGYIRRGKPTRRRRRLRGRGLRREAGRRRPRRAMSPKAICGIPAISCFAPTCCWRSLTRFEPAMVTAVEAAVAGASDDLGFLRLDAGGVRARAAEVDRLCGDGEDRPRRRGRRQFPLVRHRLLGRDLRHRRSATRPATPCMAPW